MTDQPHMHPGFNRIFGLGLSKTGTTSLSAALEMLGVSAIHFPQDAQTFEQLRSGQFRLSILERYQAVTDTPVVPYYAQFDALYPDSRFILTLRDVDAWLESVRSQWAHSDAWASTNPAFLEYVRFTRAAVYGVWSFNAERMRFVYEQHTRNVRAYFADKPGRLLEMDITAGDGWAQLCPFLGLPAPADPFPRAYTRESRRADQTWTAQFLEAMKDIESHVAAGSRLLLVDEQQLDGSRLSDIYQAESFPSCQGVYQGPPADGNEAAERLRSAFDAGETAIAFFAHTKWWLTHYAELAACLRERGRKVVDAEHLTLYILTGDSDGVADSARMGTCDGAPA